MWFNKFEKNFVARANPTPLLCYGNYGKAKALYTMQATRAQ